MCSPIAAAAGVAAGGALSAMGAYTAGQAAKDQANAEAREMARNADILNSQADDFVVKRGEDGQQQELSVRDAKIAMRQSFATRGVSTSSDVVTKINRDISIGAAIDRRNYNFDTKNEEFRLRSGAFGLHRQRAITIAKGRAAARAGTFQAVGTLASSAASAYSTHETLV